MSKIGKILLAFAATALAMTAFASAAMAGTGELRDVETDEPIPAEHTLHFVGWAEFVDASNNGFKCHVTAIVEATSATTGHVRVFTVQNTENCEGTGVFQGCDLIEHESTNLPWHVTTTKTGFDISGNIEIHNSFVNCPSIFPVGRIETADLGFSEVTATPLATGERAVTGTEGGLGEIAGAEAPIAGISLSGEGESHVTFSTGFEQNPAVEVRGELELTDPDYATWFIKPL